MAKLQSGTIVYGTATVNSQLFVTGSNQSTSTTTGALTVVGGAGIGGGLVVGGAITATSVYINGYSVTTSTTAVPAGSNTQVQINSSGTFGAAPIYSTTSGIAGNYVNVAVGINNSLVSVNSNASTPNATLSVNGGTAYGFVIAGYSSNIGNSPAYDAFFTGSAYLGDGSGNWYKQGGTNVKPTVLRLGGYGGGASFYSSNSTILGGNQITDFSLTLDIGSSGGVVVGSATGGNQGAGTLNATGLYINGVAVPNNASGSSAYTPLAYAATITPVVANAVVRYAITATNNLTINTPTGTGDNDTCYLRILSSGGSYTLTMSASYKLPSTGTTVTFPLTMTSGKEYDVVVQYSALRSQWQITQFLGAY